LALLILWTTNIQIRTAASIPASALSFISAISILQLSYLEHTRSISPSTPIILYLSVGLFLDIPQARTLFLRHDNLPIAVIFSLTIVTKLLLLFLQSHSKTKYLKSPYVTYPPEITSGVWTRSLLWWLMPLFTKGFKSLLSLDDLFPMDPTMSSEILRNRMQTTWDQRCESAPWINGYYAHSPQPSRRIGTRYL